MLYLIQEKHCFIWNVAYYVPLLMLAEPPALLLCEIKSIGRFSYILESIAAWIHRFYLDRFVWSNEAWQRSCRHYTCARQNPFNRRECCQINSICRSSRSVCQGKINNVPVFRFPVRIFSRLLLTCSRTTPLTFIIIFF